MAPPAPAAKPAAAEEAPSAEKLRQNAIEEQVEGAKRSKQKGEEQLGECEWKKAVVSFDEALEVFNMIAGRRPAEGDPRKPPLTMLISKEEVLTVGLPELYCRKAEALLQLGQCEDALEAATEAASLKPPSARLHCRSHCLAAAALRRLSREDAAALALQRFERVAQEHAAILAQRQQLLSFQKFYQTAPATDTGKPSHPSPPACQPPLAAPATLEPRAAQSGLLDPPSAPGERASCRVSSLLLAVFGEEDVRGELLGAMSLHSKRAACVACYTLRSHVSHSLHGTELYVRIEDATFDNAAFVGRLPNLATLHVQGEQFLANGIDLANLRTIKRITVGKLSFEAALFVGAALSGGEHQLRLSSDSCVLLPPLRTRERINLANRRLKDQDLGVLLGALSLNRHLKELDFSDRRSDVTFSANVRAAMVSALPWQLLRHKGAMRFELSDPGQTLF